MSLLATAFGTKVAIAALSLVAIGGGTAVAAAAGVLPALPTSVQTGDPTAAATPTPEGTDTADPAAAPTVAPTGTPSPSASKGPDATGPAAFGLCTAFTAGGLHSASVAYTALLGASKAAGSIAAYCAPIIAAHDATPDHGPSSTPTPESAAPAVRGHSSSAHGNASPGSDGH